MVRGTWYVVVRARRTGVVTDGSKAGISAFGDQSGFARDEIGEVGLTVAQASRRAQRHRQIVTIRTGTQVDWSWTLAHGDVAAMTLALGDLCAQGGPRRRLPRVSSTCRPRTGACAPMAANSGLFDSSGGI